MSKKTDPFYDDSLNISCPITNKDVLDDCHIVVEFGYGSDLDMTTYTFSPVHEEVGKKVIAYIQSLMPKNHSVEEFSVNIIEDLCNSDSQEWTDQEKKDHGLE